MRDARIFRIFEGANEILRLFIALEGIKSAGAGLKQVLDRGDRARYGPRSLGA